MFNNRLAQSFALMAALVASGDSFGDQVKMNVALGHPVLKADSKQTTYLKVSLTGFKLAKLLDRAPVNVAIVLVCLGTCFKNSNFAVGRLKSPGRCVVLHRRIAWIRLLRTPCDRVIRSSFGPKANFKTRSYAHRISPPPPWVGCSWSASGLHCTAKRATRSV